MRPETIRLAEDQRFEIRASTIIGAGKGLFARIELPAGDKLEVFGPRIAADSVEDTCTSFADTHKFRLGDQLIVPFGLAGMANHSTHPNVGKCILAQIMHGPSKILY
ncbi:MAG: hypothetical protein WCO91_07005, partial [Gemmataceae bacterium]